MVISYLKRTGDEMNEKRFTVMKKFDGSYVICDKGKMLVADDCCDLLNEQQAAINELQSIINHIKCEENCEDYDYCCETVCSLYNEIKHLKEENEQLRNELTFLNKVITFFADNPMTKYSSKSELLEEMKLLEKMGLI